MPVSAKSLDYCLNWVRKFETGHIYVYKCISKEIAVPYLVLQALNIELSRARSKVSVSNPSLVKGKYAFWRDVVRGAENEHPIGSALLEIIREHRIPQDVLLSLIDAKERDCTRNSFKDLDIFKMHYQETEGRILEALCKSVEPSISQPLIEGLHSLGPAHGVIRVIRSSMAMRLLGQDPGFPLDLVNKNKLSRNQISARNPWMSSAQLRHLIKDIVDVGEEHLYKGRELISKNLPSDARSSSLIKQICLFNVLTEYKFAQLRSANYLIETIPQVLALRLEAYLFYRRFTNSILRC